LEATQTRTFSRFRGAESLYRCNEERLGACRARATSAVEFAPRLLANDDHAHTPVAGSDRYPLALRLVRARFAPETDHRAPMQKPLFVQNQVGSTMTVSGDLLLEQLTLEPLDR
jgi:hypothetical protein